VVPILKGKSGTLSSYKITETIPGGTKDVTITNTLEVGQP
jgi:hypothetical protein